MSLQNKPEVKKYNLGLIVSRSFDSPSFLHEQLEDHLEKIGHIYCNGAQPGHKMVEDFCIEHGIGFTVFPAKMHMFISTTNIVKSSDFIYIISDLASKSAKFAEEECKKQEKKYRIFLYDPLFAYKERLQKIKELLASFDKEKVTENNTNILTRIDAILNK